MNPAIEWLEAEFDKVKFKDITAQFNPGFIEGLQITGPVYDPINEFSRLNEFSRPMIQFMDEIRQSDEFHRNKCTICNDPAELYARNYGNR